MKIMINISIDVSKIDKTRLFKGEKGTYLNITVDERQQPDNYGNTHTVYMQQSKDERTAKTPKVYLGNGKEFKFNNQQQGQQNAPQQQAPPANNDAISDLPF
jgi:hypothetical protein